MIYPDNFETKIGFDSVRKVLESKCMSPLGIMHCKSMRFSDKFNEIDKNLNKVNEFLNIIISGVEFPLNDFFDVTPALNSIKAEGSYMQEDQLHLLRRSLSTIGAIVQFFKEKDETETSLYPTLTETCSNMQQFPEIIREIDRILDKFGNIKDNASPELFSIRKSIQNTTASINGMLRRIISTGKQNGYLDKDSAPSVRDGRLVIPVAPMNKRKINGIVHDESATGKTIFIEPAEIVEANNTIREFEGEMRREILRILNEVSAIIRPHIQDMLISYDILGEIDFIRAKAIYAQEINATKPHLEQTVQIEWYHAFHPVLFASLKEQGKTIVPLNIKLDPTSRILVISGPNAGGKSICLKTVGIIQYMTQCGLLPPVYTNSHIGIFSSIFIDIGDEQSLENDLSTYSSHLTNMKTAITKGDAQSLILIDEFGSGTEPQIGGAMAQSILHRFNEKKMFGVITTHYQNLKLYADNSDGIVNGAMLYDRNKMEPLFQLSVGYPGSSFAIEIARKIGLPQEIITEAQEIAGSDYVNMDKYLLDISRDRKYWEKKRQDIHVKQKKIDALVEKYNSMAEKLNSERNEIVHAAKAQAKDILAQSNATIEKTIHEIKKAQAEKEATKEIRKQLDEFKSRLKSNENNESPLISTIRTKKKDNNKSGRTHIPKDEKDNAFIVNDVVKLDDSTTPGKIISIDGNNAIVAFGNLKTKVKLSRLKKTAATKMPTTEVSFLSTKTSDEMRKRQLDFKQEIDVRGMRADEAIQAVTYFIDDATQFNASRVRILHGTGTGILRERIRAYLNTLPCVHSFRDEHVQFGGAGITIVDIE